VFTWIGRRKQTGRGQGASGLEFDRIDSARPRLSLPQTQDG
jgi:hypothetical protein